MSGAPVTAVQLLPAECVVDRWPRTLVGIGVVVEDEQITYAGI
jgi:hypothetical protein